MHNIVHKTAHVFAMSFKRTFNYKAVSHVPHAS